MNLEPESLYYNLNYFDILKMIQSKRYNVKMIKKIHAKARRRKDTQRGGLCASFASRRLCV